MSTPQSPRSRQRTEAHEPTLELNSLRVPTISTTSRDSRPFEDSRIKTERDDNSSTARRGIQYPPATDDARPNAAGNDLGVSSHRKPVICENFNGLRKLDDTASRYVDGDVNHYIRLCTRNVSNDGFIHACPGHNTRDHDLSNCPELKKWKAKELFHWLVESRNGKPPFYYNYPLWKLWPGKWDKTPPSRLGPLRPQTPAYALSLRGKQEDITQSIPDPFWDEPHSDSEMMLEMECILPKDSDLDNAAPPSTSCLSHRAQGTENSKANVKQVEIGNTSSAKGSLGGFHRPTEIARQSSRLRIQGFGVHEPPARQSRSPSNQTGHHRHRDHRSKSPVFRRQSPSDLHSASQEHVYLQQPYRTRSTWRDQAATVEDFRSNGRLAQMFSQEGSRDVSLETDHMVRDTARHGRLDNMSGRGGMPALYDSSSRSPGRFSPRDNPEQYDIRSRAHQQDHRVVHPLMASEGVERMSSRGRMIFSPAQHDRDSRYQNGFGSNGSNRNFDQCTSRLGIVSPQDISRDDRQDRISCGTSSIHRRSERMSSQDIRYPPVVHGSDSQYQDRFGFRQGSGPSDSRRRSDSPRDIYGRDDHRDRVYGPEEGHRRGWREW